MRKIGVTRLGRNDIVTAERTRNALTRCVNEDHKIALAYGFGQFRQQLVAGDDIDIMTLDALGQMLRGMPSQAVIPPQWVSVTDDEYSCHRNSIIKYFPPSIAWKGGS